MHPSIFGMHVIDPNSKFHKLSVVFATTCAPLLLAFHELGLQIGKCCELNHEMRIFSLNAMKNFNYNTYIVEIKVKCMGSSL